MSHSSKKCEIKCPRSRKKLTTQYKFCLVNADAKRPGGGGVSSMRSPADNGGRGEIKNGEILRISFMDGPLGVRINARC